MNAHFQRASMLMEQARYSLAEDELRQALAQDPDDGMAHAMLALCLSYQEKFNDAQQEVETAIHLIPDQPFPRVNSRDEFDEIFFGNRRTT